jgi:hypothetical protein
MKQKLVFLVVLIGIFLYLTINALSADFTFYINVKLAALPQSTWPKVVCDVIDKNSMVIGSGTTAFDLNNYGYWGWTNVEVNAIPGKNPADAKKWVCSLQRRATYGDMYSTGLPLSCAGGSGTYDKAPNTTCKLAVGGDIPQ